VNPLFNSAQCKQVVEGTRIVVLLCAPEHTQKFVEAQSGIAPLHCLFHYPSSKFELVSSSFKIGIIQHVIEFDQLPGRASIPRYTPPSEAKVTIHSFLSIEQRGRDAITKAGKVAGRALAYNKEKNKPDSLITIGTAILALSSGAWYHHDTIK
jgi:hypothetical protein